MKLKLVPLIAAVAYAGAAAAQAPANNPEPQRSQTAVSGKPAHAASMKALEQSAQQLRESIQALAQKPPGAQRDRAIARAHQALLDTQRAMLALPPPAVPPSGPAAATGAAYDESVAKLLKAADRLRDSIIAIAQGPDAQGRARATEQAQQALWETRLALVSAYDPGASRAMGAGAQPTGGSAGTQQPDKAASGAGASAAQPSAVLVLAPVQMASDEKLANGCWVRFYDGTNFNGTTLTLAGPVEMPRMYPARSVWRDWESAVVGPKARVTTFDEENFRERTANLAPGQRIPDLRDSKLGWFDEVHSAKVACTG